MSTPFVTHALPTDEGVLAAVGRIALRHGQLDNQWRRTIGQLAGISKEEALDGTAMQGSRDLRETVKKLAKQRLGESAPLIKLRALLEISNRATAKRNELLHSVWGTELDADPMVRRSDHSFIPCPTVEELDAVQDEIVGVLYDLIEARFDGFLAEALDARSIFKTAQDSD